MTDDYSDETRYRILDGGAVYDLQLKKISAHLPGGKYAITPQNAHLMQARKREIAQIGVLRGLARKAGVDVDQATLEEIAQGAGTAIEKLTGHLYDTFLQSKNVRGLAESFRALITLGGGEERSEREVHHTHYLDNSPDMRELMKLLQKAISPDAGEVIDA